MNLMVGAVFCVRPGTAESNFQFLKGEGGGGMGIVRAPKA